MSSHPTPLPPLISTPPPLHPTWLAHEQKKNLSLPTSNTLIRPTSIEQRRFEYSNACIQRNNEVLAFPENGGLISEIKCEDWDIPSLYPSGPIHSENIRVRTYRKQSVPIIELAGEESLEDIDGDKGNEEIEIIYYHGGGLIVGDLDSEDLSCRRICWGLGYTVHSIDYTLLSRPQPSFPPLPPSISNRPLRDAFIAFTYLVSRSSSPSPSSPSSKSKTNKPKTFILIGSSSGGQLVSQLCLLSHDLSPTLLHQIKGVFLRCPVAVDASSTSGLMGIDEGWRTQHLSFSEAFETSLLRLPISSTASVSGSSDGIESEGMGIPIPYKTALKTYKSQTSSLPLRSFPSQPALDTLFYTASIPLPLTWRNFKNFPKTGVQLCTNDIYYSDGAILARGVGEVGIEVRCWVWEGWPHTFWLKGVELGEAEEAEGEMLRGVRWLVGDNGEK